MVVSPTAQHFGGRIPKQVQRVIPVVFALLFFIWVSAPSISLPTLRHKRHASLSNLHEFPRKVWQTWKVDALNFEERDLTRARTWVTKNPAHRYEVLTDNNDVYYVEQHFGPDGINRPDIVELYRSISAKIIKADLLRYLIMYVEGGLYTDIDVEALKPIERFIPDRYNIADIDMVIGIEIDQPEFSEHPVLGQKCKSFCQWTFMCKPRLPVMLDLVENIASWLNGLSKKQGKPISQLDLDFDEVITGTGPSAFTSAVLKYMSQREGRPVDWTPFHAMSESKVVGGVLVLTVEAFAAGQGHSDSGNHDARGALVKHRYHASGWPTTHPRYLHPVFGEVEHCNWVADCVKKWDEDTAAFAAMPLEEQQKTIAMKEAKAAAEALLTQGIEKGGQPGGIQIPPPGAFPPGPDAAFPPAFPVAPVGEAPLNFPPPAAAQAQQPLAPPAAPQAPLAPHAAPAVPAEPPLPPLAPPLAPVAAEGQPPQDPAAQQPNPEQLPEGGAPAPQAPAAEAPAQQKT